MAESRITKKALAQAMKEMMETTPFEKISVGDICAQCGMNRKSFYYHFKDKYDLVNWIYDTEFLERLRPDDMHSVWDYLVELCDYFYANRSFYVSALAVQGQNSFSDYFDELLQPVIQAYLTDMLTQEEGRECAVFYADGIRMAIQRWLTERPELDGAAFVALLRHIVTSTALKLLQLEEDGPAPMPGSGG